MLKEDLDIRNLPPAHRYEKLLTTFKNLAPAESFEFVNDHDPKPVYFQFCSIFGDVVDWEYLEEGPEVWKIKVTKTGEPREQPHQYQPESNVNSADIPVVKEFDVRSRPCVERRALVFSSFEELNPGEAFTFINDHDPRPLSFKLEEEYDAPFKWEYIHISPEEWKIKVSKM